MATVVFATWIPAAVAALFDAVVANAAVGVGSDGSIKASSSVVVVFYSFAVACVVGDDVTLARR